VSYQCVQVNLLPLSLCRFLERERDRQAAGGRAFPGRGERGGDQPFGFLGRGLITRRNPGRISSTNHMRQTLPARVLTFFDKSIIIYVEIE
jgi:hypothetical protein